MNIDNRQPNRHKSEVLYVTPNGQLKPFDSSRLTLTRSMCQIYKIDLFTLDIYLLNFA